MDIPENFIDLKGEWTGDNKLYLSPNDPIKVSASVATIAFEVKNKFLKINYDWIYEEEKQEGLLIFCFRKNSVASSIWIDSWHQGSAFMNSIGMFESNKISVQGSYTMPKYSDWSWRTEVKVLNENSFSFTMYNISPDGKEDIAVESKFNRKM